MNNLNRKKIQGIGLVEVLVATVVIALGLMSVASMQGNFMSNSADNKARSVALALAEQKIEEFKDNINIADFNAHAAGTESDTPNGGAGANATYTRTWVITDAGDPDDLDDPVRKKIAVNVAWGDATDEQVNLTGEVVWADPGKAAIEADAADGNGTGGLAPSPNNNSSILGEDADDDGNFTKIVIDTDFNPNLKQGRDIKGQTTLVDDSGTLLTCFGGVLHQIKGEVLTVNSLSNINVAISPYGYCEFNRTTGKYICFYCGNCKEMSSDINGCETSGSNPISNEIGAGGWYGKVGLKGVGDTASLKEKVCFSEQLLNVDAEAATGREYVSRRVTVDGNDQITSEVSEGINQSFDCQNFLIVNSSPSGTPCRDAAGGYPEKHFAPKQMIRQLVGNSVNNVPGEDGAYCSSGVTSYSFSVEGTIVLPNDGLSNPEAAKIRLSCGQEVVDIQTTKDSGRHVEAKFLCSGNSINSLLQVSLVSEDSGLVITEGVYSLDVTSNIDGNGVSVYTEIDFTVNRL